jgi:hypothetical protein
MCNGGSYYVAKILLLLMLLAGRFAVSFICTQYTRAQGASSSIHNIVGPGGLLLIYCILALGASSTHTYSGPRGPVPHILHLGPSLLIHIVGPGGLFLIYVLHWGPPLLIHKVGPGAYSLRHRIEDQGDLLLTHRLVGPGGSLLRQHSRFGGPPGQWASFLLLINSTVGQRLLLKQAEQWAQWDCYILLMHRGPSRHISANEPSGPPQKWDRRKVPLPPHRQNRGPGSLLLIRRKSRGPPPHTWNSGSKGLPPLTKNRPKVPSSYIE